MKYIRILIAVLVFILIGVGAYYVYLITGIPNKNKVLNTEDTEKAVQFTFNPNTSVNTKLNEYTSAGLKSSGESVVIDGRFQAIDPVEKEINGVAYTYVLGILDDNGVFSRIWLTTNEYGQIRKAISDKVRLESLVKFTLNRENVSLVEVSVN